jgi:5-hydroxyisourate hydrolase
MGKLSTHVLDTRQGKPAGAMKIELFRVCGTERKLITSELTNHDGRCNEPLLQGPALVEGVYELVFHAGNYFAGQGIDLPEPRFVDQVLVRFGIADATQNYHVPLLVTPWSWSTYRGS